ncbi:MAG: hypothetical protein AVDCRST_MAG61-2169, partial [uncultured Friedmanniella sp.]
GHLRTHSICPRRGAEGRAHRAAAAGRGRQRRPAARRLGPAGHPAGRPRGLGRRAGREVRPGSGAGRRRQRRL